MNTETQTLDLSKLSLEELESAIQAKKNEKNNNREAYKNLVAEQVPKTIFKLCHASEILSNAKTDTFKDFEAILNLKNEVYGLKEKQMSHTFSTDKEEITIGYRINDGWDDTVTAGIEKVQSYISSLSKSPETAALVKMVFGLLKKDAKGNLKGSRVLELQKMASESNNPEFIDGVDIISKAFKPVRSSWFIEAYLIGENGKKTNIPLSMSSAGFSSGYKFDFFTDKLQDNGSNN